MNNRYKLIFLLITSFAANYCTNDDVSTSVVSLDAPTITSVDPVAGKVGTPVTITGTNFSSNATENIVKFNEIEAKTILFASERQLSTVIPPNATTGQVSVKVGSQTSKGPDFTVWQLSLSLNPVNGEVGKVVIIQGNGFSDQPAENMVMFNGINATVTEATTTTITTTVPKNATTGPVSVIANGLTQISNDFVVIESAETPENFKIAFIGDATIGPNADAVLNLIKNEGAGAVVHAGDLDYIEDPQAFENNINGILGASFPYFFCVGNHDDAVWNGPDGYQAFQEARFNRLGVTWNGQLGVLSSFSYRGIFFVVTAPDEFGITPEEAGNYIRDQLKTNDVIWRISFWHKNQRLMQIGGKSDEAGWNVYDESRKGGAIIATGHEHSYSRTFEMRNFQNQIISNTSNMVTLRKDVVATNNVDEGRSFAFVSGLGGRGIRDAESGLDNNPWWADVFHSDNGGQYGALFGEFNHNGDKSLARFYFKDIDGKERDEFFVTSEVK